jgi:molybdopterin molybdotransferase
MSAPLPTPDEAWQTIVRFCDPAPAALVSLDDALGLVLAEAIRADRDLPPSDRSAMDGFAFAGGPTPGSAKRVAASELRLVGEIPAGARYDRRLQPGECVRIFTGAMLPAGADTVAMVEHAEVVDTSLVRIPDRIEQGANVLRQGEDAHAGDGLVSAGTRLGPVQLAVAAAVGAAPVLAYPRPSVAVLTTGRELRAPEEDAQPHQVRDSNATLLAAALRAESFPVALRRRVTDDRRQIVSSLQEALQTASVVVLSGGVSVGDYDYVPRAVTEVGARIVVHGVAMKPGKPFLFATGPAKQLIFGLPGHPLATLTGLHEFVLPALRRAAGLPEALCRPAWTLPLSHSLKSKTGRHRFHLARLETTAEGMLLAPLASQSSADLVAGGRADGAIVVPPDVAFMAAGQRAVFRPWSRP